MYPVIASPAPQAAAASSGPAAPPQAQEQGLFSDFMSAPDGLETTDQEAAPLWGEGEENLTDAAQDDAKRATPLPEHPVLSLAGMAVPSLAQHAARDATGAEGASGSLGMDREALAPSLLADPPADLAEVQPDKVMQARNPVPDLPLSQVPPVGSDKPADAADRRPDRPGSSLLADRQVPQADIPFVKPQTPAPARHDGPRTGESLARIEAELPATGTPTKPATQVFGTPAAIRIFMLQAVQPDGRSLADAVPSDGRGDSLPMAGQSTMSAGPHATTGNVSPGVPGAAAGQQLATQMAQALVVLGNGSTEIALAPEELGHVRVTLQPDSQRPDHMVVTLSFERPETQDLFRRHVDLLLQTLRDAGFSGADISYGQFGSGPQSGRAARDDTSADLEVRPDAILLETLHQPATRIPAGSSIDLRV